MCKKPYPVKANMFAVFALVSRPLLVSHLIYFDSISVKPPPLENNETYRKPTPLLVSRPLHLLHICQLSHPGRLTRAITVCTIVHVYVVYTCI